MNSHARAALLGILLGALVSSAGAGDIATERTQAATGFMVTTISTLTETISGITREIEGLERIAKRTIAEGAGFGNYPLAGELFGIFDDIENVYNASRALGQTVEDTETFFNARFDDYDGYLQAIANVGEIREVDVIGRIREWNRTHNETIKATLKSHGIQAAEVADSESRLQFLQQKSRTAGGRMQALQIGQEIAAEEIQQVQALKKIIVDQTNLQASFYAFKQAEEADQEARSTWIRRDIAPTTLGDERASGAYR